MSNMVHSAGGNLVHNTTGNLVHASPWPIPTSGATVSWTGGFFYDATGLLPASGSVVLDDDISNASYPYQWRKFNAATGRTNDGEFGAGDYELRVRVRMTDLDASPTASNTWAEVQFEFRYMPDTPSHVTRVYTAAAYIRWPDNVYANDWADLFQNDAPASHGHDISNISVTWP